MNPKQPIIILDRDGVINHDSDKFIKSPEEWIPIDGSMEALGKLTVAGYSIFILTNQSGLARGYFSKQTLSLIHQKMMNTAKKYGAVINHIFYCPHGPNDNCDCRKPKPGLYIQLQELLGNNYSLKNVPSLGDSIRDLQAAKAAGAQPVLVRTGKGKLSERLLNQNQLQNTPIYNSLADYTKQLLDN